MAIAPGLGGRGGTQLTGSSTATSRSVPWRQDPMNPYAQVRGTNERWQLSDIQGFSALMQQWNNLSSTGSIDQIEAGAQRVNQWISRQTRDGMNVGRNWALGRDRVDILQRWQTNIFANMRDMALANRFQRNEEARRVIEFNEERESFFRRMRIENYMARENIIRQNGNITNPTRTRNIWRRHGWQPPQPGSIFGPPSIGQSQPSGTPGDMTSNAVHSGQEQIEHSPVIYNKTVSSSDDEDSFTNLPPGAKVSQLPPNSEWWYPTKGITAVKPDPNAIGGTTMGPYSRPTYKLNPDDPDSPNIMGSWMPPSERGPKPIDREYGGTVPTPPHITPQPRPESTPLMVTAKSVESAYVTVQGDKKYTPNQVLIATGGSPPKKTPVKVPSRPGWWKHPKSVAPKESVTDEPGIGALGTQGTNPIGVAIATGGVNPNLTRVQLRQQGATNYTGPIVSPNPGYKGGTPIDPYGNERESIEENPGFLATLLSKF